ncbi:MAG: hypothetical protein CVT63_07250 [Candidatus Anoxymicrobium japonicum]|uniref:Uncharacterized protein n=1 Tax=Candidatus Anoxymicrobium japonicum TaxID=2013648 RepID=A0A2N3G4B5_9ACTN|nr:MAG: hypothetical protein CVT63_07250 [Candidatus Anoxymicrobium japonicum]
MDNKMHMLEKFRKAAIKLEEEGFRSNPGTGQTYAEAWAIIKCGLKTPESIKQNEPYDAETNDGKKVEIKSRRISQYNKTPAGKGGLTVFDISEKELGVCKYFIFILLDSEMKTACCMKVPKRILERPEYNLRKPGKKWRLSRKYWQELSNNIEVEDIVKNGKPWDWTKW